MSIAKEHADSHSTARDLIFAAASGVIVTLFFLILLWRDPLLFWNDDYELSILPVFADVARSWSEGHLPLLSPYSWICGNLAGEFQYGTFSIFVNAAVVLIWKFPLAFAQQAAALSIVHLFVLAMGGYMLARGREIALPGAIMVALVAALNGWIVCWGAIDWFGALGAFTWFPWAWWAAERALDERRSRWRFLWPAPFVYLVVTGGFPYTVVMLALLLAWLAVKSVTQTRRLFAGWPLVLGTLIGLGLSAPAWLALFDYVHGSARQAQASAEHFQWIVPVTALPGFILPSWTVNWTNFFTRPSPHAALDMACGLAPIVLVIWILATRFRVFVRRCGWELALLLLVLTISMLPSANLFRWSFRWLPFFHVILALCAAEALRDLDFVARGNSVFRTLTARPSVVSLMCVAAVAALMYALNAAGYFSGAFVAAIVTLCVAWIVIEKLFVGSVTARLWTVPAVTFAAFLITYLCIPPNCGTSKYKLTAKLRLAAPLDARRLYLSIYPQPEIYYCVPTKNEFFGEVVRPGSTSMWGGVRFINGYSPIRPAGIARELNTGIHGEVDFAQAKRLLESEAAPAGEMAELGIDGLIIAPEMKMSGPVGAEWQVAHSSSEGVVYHRRGEPLGAVRSLARLGSRPGESFAPAPVTLREDSRTRIVVDVDASSETKPMLLAFSRPFFRGYHATLNGKGLSVESNRGLNPVVQLPPSSHGRLILTYRPWWITIGAVIAAVSFAIWVIGLFAASRTPISSPA